MSSSPSPPPILSGQRVAFVGRLASMGRREAAQLIRRYGGTVLEHPDASVRLVVVGEEGLPLPEFESVDDWFDEAGRKAIEAGTLEVITETQLWQRLGLVDQQQDLNRLYTPAMLAELLGVQVEVIRQCHRRGLIRPAREVRRLPYFDFAEVAHARRIVQLLAAKVKPGEIEKKLAALSRLLPGVQHPLTQPSVIVQGKQILLRQGDELIEPGGQLRLDFEAWEEQPPQTPAAEHKAGPSTAEVSEPPRPAALPFLSGESGPDSPEAMRRLAAELEEEGQLAAAAEMCRAALAASGPDPESCFQLAELLYRLGDLSAARERYYMAIELDEDYVEARANLGCVLAETGQPELAVAAFEGALRYHAGYADVHYHLARTLDELGRRHEAEDHWRTFLGMAPDNPWAHEAQTRLAQE
jgi:tetratricopeptide (TPR) repeat protein